MNLKASRSFFVLLAVLLACTGAETSAPRFSVMDSSGVQIVTSRAPVWPEGTGWTIAVEPSVVIGTLDGPIESAWGAVSAVGWLPDGRIFVGDQQAYAIRVFSEAGEYLESFGREGQGPGELQWFETVSPYRGDSLFVYDYRLQAVSIFSSNFAFARRASSRAFLGNRVLPGLSDGQILVYGIGLGASREGTGLVPDIGQIVLVDPEAIVADTIADFELTTVYLGPSGRELPLHLQPYAYIAVRLDRIIVSEGKALQYTELGLDGAIRRIVRTEADPVVVDQDIREAFEVHFAEWLAYLGPERIQRALEEGHYYPTLPVAGPIHIDPLDNVWVGRYRFPGLLTYEWEVFTPEGVWLGSVESPPDLDVKEIGVDRVIGLKLGDFDVPYVQVHRLERT